MKTQGIFIVLSLAIFGIVHSCDKCENDLTWYDTKVEPEMEYNCESMPVNFCTDERFRQPGKDFTDVEMACPSRCEICDKIFG